MKILFIGDYSNLHATIAKELQNRDYNVTVLSDRCGYVGSHADIFIKRETGLKGGVKYLFNLFNILPTLKDYDVVQFINPNFFKLKPGRIKYFFDRLKNQNGNLFLTLAGNDYYFCKACYDAKVFRFSEFKIGDNFTEFHDSNPNLLYGWTSHVNKKWNEYFYDKIDGAMSILPEYDMVAKQIIPEKTVFTNLPIDINSLPVSRNVKGHPIKLFIGIRSGMEIQKGTKKLLKIAEEIKEKMPHTVSVETVSDLPLSQFLSRMSTADIVLDQLYAYSPATTALMAMGMSKVAATGAQPEYYEYVGHPEIQPILSLSPLDTDIKDKLISLIQNPSEIQKRGKQSKELVKKNNDVKIVTDKFIEHWQKQLK